MIEQLFFITISVVLFVAIFFKMIKRNDTGYIVILLLEALGIIIDGARIIFDINNTFLKILTYSISIIIPILILILEYRNIDIMNLIKFVKVRFFIATENTKKAKELLIKLVEKDTNNYNAHKYLATIYEKEGGIRKAIDEYVICIDINKKDYNSYYKVAILLEDLGKIDEAIEMLSNLLNKKTDYYDATIALGNLLIEKGNYKEAISRYSEALKNNPISFELNYELGIAYTMLNDFQSAKECYERAAEINSLCYNAKYSLAQIALLYKDLDLAEEYFQKSLEDEDLQADSYYELAKIKLMKGQKDIAIKYTNIAIDIESKRITLKIKKEPLFIPILSKISIPFNLEEKEECKLTKQELKAKEHLENTSNITMNMGYINVRKDKQKDEQRKNEIERES